MNTDSIKLLMLEDNAEYALMIQTLLKKTGTVFDVRLVSDKKGFTEALDSFCPAIILSDHQLPQFNSIEALGITRQKCPHVPFIIVTGTVSDEFAAIIIKSGADDYILKDRLTRLPGAINAALKQRLAEEERKEAEQQKVFDSNNLKSLINNTNDLMWSVDRNFNLITANEAFEKMVKSLSGHSILKGTSILSLPFSKEQLSMFRTFYERAFTGENFTEIVHKEAPVYLSSEISFCPILKENEVVGTACFSRDITERKKGEEQLNKTSKENKQLADRMYAIINTLPANIALLDENGIVVDINDAWRCFADTNGFVGSNYGIGSNYIALSRSADGEKVAQGIEAVLHHQVREFVFEYPCHSPKINRWFRMVASPLLGKEYSGAVVMHIDISELRKLEQERLQTKIAEQKLLSQAVIMGQEIERNHISQELHDNINQLLIGSKMYLSIAGNKNEMVKEYIKYPMELLNNSIEEIRLLCRNLVTPVKNIDLEELVKALLLNINEVTKATTSLTYRINGKPISDDLKLNIYRILQEQVNNILKHSEAKNVNVSILAEKDTIVITLKDDGKGFDTEKKRTGLGISNIINRMGIFDGEIDIKSSLGQGCKLQIKIPY